MKPTKKRRKIIEDHVDNEYETMMKYLTADFPHHDLAYLEEAADQLQQIIEDSRPIEGVFDRRGNLRTGEKK
jgi:hypothetical protein